MLEGKTWPSLTKLESKIIVTTKKKMERLLRVEKLTWFHCGFNAFWHYYKDPIFFC